jgi:endo-1,4-beta-xylanase
LIIIIYPSLDSLTNYCKPKIDGLMKHVAKWRAAGVPIDCIGSQSHLSAGDGPAAATAFKKLCTGAPLCAVTELDIQSAPPKDYVAIVKACYDTPNCVGVTVWGVLDGQSWRRGSQGLLFDDSGNPKAAYNAIANALS